MEENKRPFEELLLYFKKAGIKNPEAKLQFFQENLLKFINHPEKHHHILLTAYNVPDGIGDFVNLLDYYEWVKNIFQAMQNVHIHAVGVVSASKEAVAKKVLPDNFDNYIVVDKNNFKNSNLDLDSREIILIKCENLMTDSTVIDSRQLRDIFDNCKNLQMLFSKTNFLLNLATPFEAIQNLFLNYINPSSCLIRSILEYGPKQPLGGHLKSNNNEYTELSMGFAHSETGIKFNEDIFSARGADKNQKIEALLKLDNHTLLKRLLNTSSFANQVVSAYFRDHHIGMGYLQSEEHTTNFIKLLVATSQGKNIDAIIATNQFSLDKIKEFLEEKNINKVIIYDNTGEEIIAHNVNQVSEKIIRLFTYAGSSHNDTNIFFTIADMAGGSGDKSLSNVIACGTFPFIGSLGHKYGTTGLLVDYVKKIPELSNKILINYLTEMAKEKIDIDALCTYAASNYKEIASAWFLVGEHLHEHKHAKTYFAEVVYNYLLFRLFENTKYAVPILDIIKEIYGKINLNTVKVCKQNLLFIAIDCNNSIAVEKLLTFPFDLEEITKKLKLTALQYCLFLKKEPIASALIKSGAALDKPFLNTSNALVYAIKNNLSDDLIKEIINYMGNISFYNPGEDALALNYLITRQELVNKFLSKNIEAKNLCLYHAIKTNNYELAKSALISGANIDLYDVNTLKIQYAVKDGNTLLHLACNTSNEELVKLLLDFTSNQYIFDISNHNGQTLTSSTNNLAIIELLQKRSYQERFHQISKILPSSISYDLKSEKPDVIIKFRTFDEAWNAWQFMKENDINIPRPKLSDQTIKVPKEIFENYMQENRSQKIKPNDHVSELININIISIINTMTPCSNCAVSPLGENGIELNFIDDKYAKTVNDFLVNIGIETTYYSHAKVIEIDSINDNGVFNCFQLIDKYQELCSKLQAMSVLSNLKPEITVDTIIINLKDEEETINLWLGLLNNNISCLPPEEGTTQLKIESSTMLAFLMNELVVEQREDIVNELMQEENRNRLITLLNSDGMSINNLTLTPYDTQGLVLTFSNNEEAEKASKILNDKIEYLSCDKYGSNLLISSRGDLEELMTKLKELGNTFEASPGITGRKF